MANPLDDLRTSLNTGIKSIPPMLGVKATLPELPALPAIESMSVPALPTLPVGAAGTNPLADLLPKFGASATNPLENLLPKFGASATNPLADLLKLPGTSSVGAFAFGLPSSYTEAVAANKKQEELMSVNRSPPGSPTIPHGEYVF
jgi:hypothetical protein